MIHLTIYQILQAFYLLVFVRNSFVGKLLLRSSIQLYEYKKGITNIHIS